MIRTLLITFPDTNGNDITIRADDIASVRTNGESTCIITQSSTREQHHIALSRDKVVEEWAAGMGMSRTSAGRAIGIK